MKDIEREQILPFFYKEFGKISYLSYYQKLDSI